MKSRFLLVLCLFIAVSGLAQQRYLRGQIIADSIQYYQVNIVNITQETGTLTSQNGTFKLAVDLNDSIVFSSLVHEFQSLVVTNSTLSKPVDIKMKRQINELPEVVVNAYDLSGELGQDVIQVPMYHLAQEALGFSLPRRLDYPTNELNRVKQMKIGFGFAVPLEYIIMSLNGDIKKLERYQNILKIEKQKEKLLAYFKTEFIVKNLKIDTSSVDDFIYFCMEDQSFIETFRNDKLAAFNEIEQKAEAYNTKNY
ncbi:MAG: hypothetical protein ACTH5N_04505 [Psychroflexus halocasei]